MQNLKDWKEMFSKFPFVIRELHSIASNINLGPGMREANSGKS